MLSATYGAADGGEGIPFQESELLRMNESRQRLEDSRLAYTVEEALNLLSIGRNKLYAEAKAGRLKLRKSGRRTLVLADDLRAYIASLPLLAFNGDRKG